MTSLFDTARGYAQSHPTSVTLLIALPGTYLLISGTSIACAVGLCSKLPTPSHSALVRPTEGLSVYQTTYPLNQRLILPTSRWDDKLTPTFIVQVIQGARKNILPFLITTCEPLGLDVHHILRNLDNYWADHFPVSRFGLVAAATALPGSFLVFARYHPYSWAAKHQSQVANVLHVLALMTVANQKIYVQDLLVTALVMVSFEAFRCSLSSVGAQRDKNSSAIETLLAQTHLTNVESDVKASVPGTVDSMQEKSPPLSGSNALTCKEEEIMRFQRSLTEAKTSLQVKEIEMKRAQADLQDTRDTLNETFAECSSLRDEMKTTKRIVGRDHQTIIYRKDIELFALRKCNEQKESVIKEKDTKLEETFRIHKATIELKDAQMQNLKERVAYLEKKDDECHVDGKVKSVGQVEGDHQAVQVKLLRVKGRNSLDVERSVEDKDAEILKLKGELAGAAKASESLAKKQDELRRAWDATYEIQNNLSEEQQMHALTKEKLQEVSIRLDEEVKRQRENGSPTRLPTIEEQDKKELETMFNAAQQDNLRLYAELDVLDKRLREANARAFVHDQEVDQLRGQLRLEKAVNEDMETARPSLVHRVHFQRMEGQLKESRDAISDKEDEILLLREDIAAKDKDIEDLQKAKEDILTDCSALQTEREELKSIIQSLETTKEQLMLDHERLAAHRSRQRTTSADHPSARSSGATLMDPNANLQVITNDAEEEPLPPARPLTMVEMGGLANGPDVGSIQNTPASAYTSPLTAQDRRLNMISDKAPPKELRGTQSKRQSLKGFMRKVVGKDPEGEKKDRSSTSKGKLSSSKSKDTTKVPTRPQTALSLKPKATSALAAKDKNALMRPKTSGVSGLILDIGVANGEIPVKEIPRPQTSGPFPTPRKATAPQIPTPSRYYAAHENQPVEDKADSRVDVSSPRPKSSGWSTSRKLVRNSVG